MCSSRDGMLEFFGSDEKLDKTGILRKTEDPSKNEEVSVMRSSCNAPTVSKTSSSDSEK